MALSVTQAALPLCTPSHVYVVTVTMVKLNIDINVIRLNAFSPVKSVYVCSYSAGVLNHDNVHVGELFKLSRWMA